ncbi:MAG: hypothetical protein PWQ37_389 [Candidatus Petromonas sp.]|nr:hypothetical protein [Candidatus Petromonas sp.]
MKKINYAIIRYKDIELYSKDAPKIRGFLSQKYSNLDILHNHDNQKYIYRYPLVQYKIIKKQPIIVAINEGIPSLLRIILETDYFDISGKIYKTYQYEIKTGEFDFGVSDILKTYKFVTPWMALNQKNYNKYLHSDLIEKDELLKSILIGNMISCSKGMNYKVKDLIRVKTNLKECIVKFKNKSMIAFKGDIVTNFRIPDYMGLGKSVSRGFGTLVGGE